MKETKGMFTPVFRGHQRRSLFIRSVTEVEKYLHMTHRGWTASKCRRKSRA